MPETLKQILQEVAIGAIVAAVAIVVWVLAVGPAVTSPWQYLAANVVILLVAGFAASAWSRRRAARHQSKGAGR